MKFSDRLKQLRLEKGITQADLADNLQLSRSAVSMYERGERTPDLETIDLFADYFNVDFDYMVGKENGSMVYMDHDLSIVARTLSERPALRRIMSHFSNMSDNQLRNVIELLRIEDETSTEE